jgi:hypothetical protein
MNTSEISRGLEEIAGEGVPATADLWPQLQAQVGEKKVRRMITPGRRAGALLAAAVLVLVLALGALTPTGTNAAANALGVFGLQPISMAVGGPSCVGPNGSKADPIFTPVEPGQFTIVTAGGEPVSGEVPTVQAMQMSCPEGYEMSFNTQPVEGNAVLNFFGVTTISTTSAAPGCVGEGGRVDVIHTDAQPGTFSVTTTFGDPTTAPAAGSVQVVNASTAAAQISCPEGYQLTINDK